MSSCTGVEQELIDSTFRKLFDVGNDHQERGESRTQQKRLVGR